MDYLHPFGMDLVTVAGATGAIIIAISLGYLVSRSLGNGIYKTGAGSMSKIQTRDSIVRSIIADGLVGMMVDLHVAEIITAAEANRWLRKFGEHFYIPDLVPPSKRITKDILHQRNRALKKQIKDRLQKSEAYAPVPFPDIVLPKEDKPSNIAEFRAKLRAVA